VGGIFLDDQKIVSASGKYIYDWDLLERKTVREKLQVGHGSFDLKAVTCSDRQTIVAFASGDDIVVKGFRFVQIVQKQTCKVTFTNCLRM
jgi:hypothetical protein